MPIDPKKISGYAIQAFFESVSWIAERHPNAKPERYGVRRLRNLNYGDGEAAHHAFDLWIPPGEGPFPVVFYIHGGGFRILSKDTHWLMGLNFARQGYITMVINYRLTPDHPYPAALEDTSRAWSWMLDHIHEYGGDTEHVVVSGESAGANLTIGLTMAACWAPPEDAPQWRRAIWERGRVPDAILPTCSHVQVTDPERFSREDPKFSKILQSRISQICADYLGEDTSRGHREGDDDFIDPINFLERAPAPQRPLPPWFSFIGTRDPLLEDTKRLKRAFDRLGAPGEIEIYPGEVHAFHAFTWRAHAQDAWERSYAFLEQVR